MAFTQYDPSKVSIIIGGFTMRATADGDMVEVEFESDEYSKHIGTMGEGRHIKNLDRSGTVTVRLADYSPSHGVLQALRKAGQPFPIMVRDKSTGSDMFFADSCTLRKGPNFAKGKEAKESDYVFQFISGEVIMAGADES